jgi:hypothetical protein
VEKIARRNRLVRAVIPENAKEKDRHGKIGNGGRGEAGSIS